MAPSFRGSTSMSEVLTPKYKMFILSIDFKNRKIRGTRERSPPLPKIAHPSCPRLGQSHASTQLSAMPGPPHEGTALLITVSSVPGKLTRHNNCSELYTDAS